MKNKMLIIDGNNAAARSLFALKDMKTSHGVPVGAVYGFMNLLLKLNSRYPEHQIHVAWDGGRASFRREIYPEYKANRTVDQSKIAFYTQTSRIRSTLMHLPVASYWQVGVEADDIIALLTKENPQADAIIYSNDNDFCQLISDRVSVLTGSSEPEIRKEDYVRLHGFDPRLSIVYKCVLGDASDNIPGVPGIGKVSLPQLIVDGKFCISSAVEKLSSSKKYCTDEETIMRIILRNVALMSLHSLPSGIFEFKRITPSFQREELLKVFQLLEFNTLINKIDQFAFKF